MASAPGMMHHLFEIWGNKSLNEDIGNPGKSIGSLTKRQLKKIHKGRAMICVMKGGIGSRTWGL